MAPPNPVVWLFFKGEKIVQDSFIQAYSASETIKTSLIRPLFIDFIIYLAPPNVNDGV
jgi:hypothetical protein